MLVKIIPKSQRAKNRVREHGETMELVMEKPGQFLVYSIDCTWKLPSGCMEKWCGWFTHNEASYVKCEK